MSSRSLLFETLSASTAKMMLIKKKPQIITREEQPKIDSAGKVASVRLYMTLLHPSSVTMTNDVTKPRKMLSNVASPKLINSYSSG